MKAFLIGVMLLTGIAGFANTGDTTVTSFEILLKRKSNDYSLGFNTSAIDRLKLYNTVMKQIRSKLSAKEFCSLHEPLVLLKFNEYNNEKPTPADEISYGEEQSLKEHQYSYFVKVYGHLNPTSPLNPFQKAIFTLKVCVFDINGKLIYKGRAKSDKSIQVIPKTAEEGHSAITEQQFLELVTDAASNLNLNI